MTTRAADTMSADRRGGTRRRGNDLEDAVYEAALDELAEVGYERLTMDRIAKRARTGKTSVYRRWPTRADLVLDALRHRPVRAVRLPDTGDLREDLLTWLRRLAVLLDGPRGATVRGLVGELPDRPGTARDLHERVLGLRAEPLPGRSRPPGALPFRAGGAGPALILHHFLIYGAPVPDDVIADIVDGVALPLLTGRSADGP
ncbi:TetR/AcrR family transcriptional regulator [Nocardia sp. alder85J]|uniref:TetR/AcrR family transcriptional regulator n=1 Tax=Nocardia sp. alder85J TaxID=2862949 RepID=UPI001CD2635F|nr:TetR/AcrR family transcriptional regulator [Nocardia sp. alder85J]MCX4096405.1 TetR/AcrR family transcriptional regulator [Nocardia sp. alder85J]